jgi:hypothetical protein
MTVLTDAQYAPLRKYLGTRFADTVVLKFGEIEDLLGVPLPETARRHPDWWAPVVGSEPSVQSRAWTESNRTAVPNLLARTVAFARKV